MGTGVSHVAPIDMSRQLKRSEADIVKLMMPVYYSTSPVTPEDLSSANYVWNMIIDDTVPKYLEMIANPDCTYSSCVMYFYDTFYNRLFDVHPLCRSMFKSGLKTQGKFLVKMISILVKDMDDEAKYRAQLVTLAQTHNERGVKAIEYGIVGEVMFWTLGEVLGRSIFTKEVHQAWIHIFSRILAIVVPVAVAFEIKTGGINQDKRVHGEKAMERNKLEFEHEPTDAAVPR